MGFFFFGLILIWFFESINTFQVIKSKKLLMVCYYYFLRYDQDRRWIIITNTS